MATFQVNPGSDDATEVEADRYVQLGNYFDFYDEDDNAVATFLQKNVREIRRMPQAK